MEAYTHDRRSYIDKKKHVEFTQQEKVSQTTKPNAITTYQALQQAIITTTQPNFQQRLHSLSTRLINKIQTTHTKFTLTITTKSINDLQKAHQIAEQTLGNTTQHNTYRKKLRIQINETNLLTEHNTTTQL